MKEKLLALAAVRYDTVNVEGEEVRVREIGTLEFARYGELGADQKDDKGAVTKKGNRIAAIAFILSNCVVDAEGNSVYSEEEALVLAGSARIGMKLVNKIMELSGSKEDDEKHAVAS